MFAVFRRGGFVGPMALSTFVVGCGPGDLASRADTEDPVDEGTGDDGDPIAEYRQQLDEYGPSKLDMVVVLDDSVSMADFRERWVATGLTWTDILLHEAVDVDFRIAFIGSSMQGSGCTNVADGAPIFSSCLGRLDELVGGPGDGEAAADLRSLCQSTCAIDDFVVVPVDVDGDLRTVPWMEVRRGQSNVANATIDDALRCATQLTIDGCDQERPLDAMRAFLERTEDPSDPAFGFVRDDAVLNVAIVTDEDDQSSASVDAYVELLRELEQRKQLDPSVSNLQPRVTVSVVGGVPLGFEAGLHPAGFSMGCTTTDGTADAAPPFRLAQFAAAFDRPGDGARNVSSVCAPDLTPSGELVAREFRDQATPGCFEACAADLDSSLSGLQPDCEVVERYADGTQVVLDWCEGNQPPAPGTACAQAVTNGKMDPICIEDGANVQFLLQRAPDSKPPPGTVVEAVCRISDTPTLECPDLPDLPDMGG